MDIVIAIVLVLVAFAIFKTLEAVLIALAIAALAVYIVRKVRAGGRRG